MSLAVNYNTYLAGLIEREKGEEKNLIDHGAGLGIIAGILRDRGNRVLCVEIDPDHISHLEADGFKIARSLAHFSDHSLDFIYSLNVLEHIRDDTAEARMMAQKLKPGGRVFIYVPAFKALYSTLDKRIGHFRRYDRRSLTALAEAGGFRVEWCAYSDFLGGILWMFYKWANDPQGRLNPRLLVLFDRLVYPVSLVFDRVTSRLFGKNVMAALAKVN
jgi:SAM-dependent methyltransferase